MRLSPWRISRPPSHFPDLRRREQRPRGLRVHRELLVLLRARIQCRRRRHVRHGVHHRRHQSVAVVRRVRSFRCGCSSPALTVLTNRGRTCRRHHLADAQLVGRADRPVREHQLRRRVALQGPHDDRQHEPRGQLHRGRLERWCVFLWYNSSLRAGMLSAAGRQTAPAARRRAARSRRDSRRRRTTSSRRARCLAPMRNGCVSLN